MVANKQGEDDGKLRARIELGDRHPDFVFDHELETFQEERFVHELYTVCTQAYFFFFLPHLHLICSNTSVFHRSLVICGKK
jgi:hypothetical protein